MGTVSGEGNNSARAPLKGLHAIFAVVNQTTLCRPILALPPTDVIISHTLSDFQIIPASPTPQKKKKELQRKRGVFYEDLGALEPPGAGAGRGHACAAAAAPAPGPLPPALMSPPATWAPQLPRRRRSPPGPAPRRGTASTAAPAPRAPGRHEFEPGEGGVKASSSPSDSNPRVQETAPSDSRDEAALSEVGSGEERRGNPSRLLWGRHACCAGLGLRSCQRSAQPEASSHTREFAGCGGAPVFCPGGKSLMCH